MLTRMIEISHQLRQNWEKYFCRVWQKIASALSPHNDFVWLIALTRNSKGSIELGGDLTGTLSPRLGDKLGITIRDMVKNKLLLEKGPVPSKNPALIVLVPLPKFLLKSNLSELQSLARDYRGEVLAEDVPYCYLTIFL